MNKKYIYMFFIVFYASLLSASQMPEKVVLQLKWHHQFQFAGYYMAKEKGFYKDAGLDVEIKEYNSNIIDIVDEVINGTSTYGIGRSSLIVDKSKGKDIVLLASIFQSSGIS